ncbi:MAG: hypothetical protein ACTH5W_20895 [Providencia sp.]|uniref:hypothetical protein n=1 Tax=Providencia sp. TaxID=589 RepID=UPI003F9B7A91
MKTKIIAIVLLLSGCSSQPLFYNEFSPPNDSKQVTIEVDVPPNTNISPLNVMYRSYKCKVSRSVSEREYRDVPGFHRMEVLLSKQESTTLFTKGIPINGGGKCDWRLSNITMGLKFNKNQPLSFNVSDFIGTNLVLIFDNNPPQINGGRAIKVVGDLTISKYYFPWLDKGVKGDKPTLRVFGGESYIYYNISNPQTILWQPKINNETYIITEYPESKRSVGIKTLIKYSDGSVSQGDSYDKKYKKLLSMMEK